MEKRDDPASAARALFKRFLAERWFGGPDFDSWVRKHPTLEAELRRLRDEWFAELGEESPGLFPPGERGARRASSFAAGEVIGGFRLQERIGSGAAGEVWVAEELALGRTVALKLLRPDLVPDPRALERFRREALAGARIHHPGVVAVYSVGRAHGQPYIAQELVEGGVTLATWIARARARGEPGAGHFEEAARLVLQAADALAAAHEAGIVHRDIKPQNILLGPGEQVKIADFGLARLAGEDVLSNTGDVMGTFCYMSPSQVRGEVRTLDGRTDVFSLGATLYELVTLRRAFAGESLQEIAHRILFEDPPPARALQPGAPRDLELICAKALEKHAADRYASMGALAEDLRSFLRGEPIQARATSFRGRVRKWTRRHPTTSAILSVSLAALLGIAWLTWTKARESRARERAEHDRLIASAQWQIGMGDMTRAEALIAEADALDPSDPIGHLLLAAGHARRGRVPESDAALAIAEDRGFFAAPETPDTALAHEAQALFLQSQRDFSLYPEAERHLRRALELDPRRDEAHLVLYQLRIAVGDEAGAREALETFQGRLPSGDPQFRIVEALRLELLGEHRAALEVLERLRGEPGMSEERLAELRWHRNAGRLCVHVGDLARGEELLRRAVADAPSDCWSWDNLAVLYFGRLKAGDEGEDNRAQAKDCARRALECSPWLPSAWMVQAYVAEYELRREPPLADPAQSAAWRAAREALDHLHGLPDRKAAEARALEADLLWLEARWPFEAGKFAQASALYARALELDPTNLYVAAFLGQCYLHLGRPAEGLEVLERALALWDDPGLSWKREPKYLGAILAWSIGNAALVPDPAAFTRARERLVAELGRGAAFEKGELLSAAEFLATAPAELRDCELAWELLDGHGLDAAFKGTPVEQAAREIVERIGDACP